MKYGFILAIVALSACPSESKVKETKPEPVIKKAVEKKVEKVPKKKALIKKEILLSKTSVGGLTATSGFDLDTIQAAFAGYTVMASEGSMEGETYKIFLVKEKETVLLEISSNDEKKVTEVIARSAKVKNEVGAQIGVTFKSLFPKKENADCHLGADDLGDIYMCAIPKIKNVRYRFETNEKGKYKPNGDWILTSLEWSP